MIKNNIKTIIFSSIVTIFPILVGIILWSKLPTSIPIHFNSNGADGWGSKSFTVFIVPFIMLITHLLSILLTSIDPESESLRSKPFAFILITWSVPFISNITMFFIFFNALNINFTIKNLCNLLVACLFMFFSIILPKYKHFFTFISSIPCLTNNNTSNIYHKTYTLSRTICFFSSFILFINFFFSYTIILILTIIITILLPIIYFYVLYKKSNNTI